MRTIIVSGFAICGGIIMLLKYLRVRKYGLIAAAVVTKVTSGGKLSKYDDVYVTFCTEDGQQVTAEQDGVRGAFLAGNAVNIIYLSDDPKTIYFSAGKRDLVLALLLISMSAVLLVLEFGDIM